MPHLSLREPKHQRGFSIKNSVGREKRGEVLEGVAFAAKMSYKSLLLDVITVF